jgi:hypothetical protein
MQHAAGGHQDVNLLRLDACNNSQSNSTAARTVPSAEVSIHLEMQQTLLMVTKMSISSSLKPVITAKVTAQQHTQFHLLRYPFILTCSTLQVVTRMSISSGLMPAITAKVTAQQHTQFHQLQLWYC